MCTMYNVWYIILVFPSFLLYILYLIALKIILDMYVCKLVFISIWTYYQQTNDK